MSDTEEVTLDELCEDIVRHSKLSASKTDAMVNNFPDDKIEEVMLEKILLAAQNASTKQEQARIFAIGMNMGNSLNSQAIVEECSKYMKELKGASQDG